MRYSSEHKQQTRNKVVAAAGQVFREEGYGGAGIDALTKAAGVTNGAFYGHFKSKSEAFRTAVVDGLADLRQGIAALQADQPQEWLKTFVAFYLGYKRTCDLKESCALPTLSSDVMRTDPETRAAYTGQLQQIADELAAGLPDGDDRQDRALVMLSLLTGAAMLARSVSDPALSERIARLSAAQAEQIAAGAAKSG